MVAGLVRDNSVYILHTTLLVLFCFVFRLFLSVALSVCSLLVSIFLLLFYSLRVLESLFLILLHLDYLPLGYFLLYYRESSSCLNDMRSLNMVHNAMRLFHSNGTGTGIKLSA